MRNEHNHPTEFHPTAENSAYTTFQVKRAAHVAQQLLDYTDTLYRYETGSGRMIYHVHTRREGEKERILFLIQYSLYPI